MHCKHAFGRHVSPVGNATSRRDIVTCHSVLVVGLQWRLLLRPQNADEKSLWKSLTPPLPQTLSRLLCALPHLLRQPPCRVLSYEKRSPLPPWTPLEKVSEKQPSTQALFLPLWVSEALVQQKVGKTKTSGHPPNLLALRLMRAHEEYSNTEPPFPLHPLGRKLRTPALKTVNFSPKMVVLVKRENGFTKTLFSLFSRVFLPETGFSKLVFAFY